MQVQVDPLRQHVHDERQLRGALPRLVPELFRDRRRRPYWIHQRLSGLEGNQDFVQRLQRKQRYCTICITNEASASRV